MRQAEERIPLSAQQIEATLIDLHWQYASLIHEKTADALVAALGGEATNAATGHTLFARLFGEFAVAVILRWPPLEAEPTRSRAC